MQDVTAEAKHLATALLSDIGRRWLHVQCVARVLNGLPWDEDQAGALVVAAGWLHDIGYSPAVRTSGFHPLDGARWLQAHDWPALVVSLVAYHSGAEFEADERELSNQLAEFDRPDPRALDCLTFADMTSSPEGERVSAVQRVEEILSRYGPGDPVNRAVLRSRPKLLASVRRTVERFGLSDEGL